MMLSCLAGNHSSVSGVLVGPGAIALTVMPNGPSVLASERVSPITPALAEVYGTPPANPPERHADDDKLMMRPYFLCIMCTEIVRAHRYSPGQIDGDDRVPVFV